MLAAMNWISYSPGTIQKSNCISAYLNASFCWRFSFELRLFHKDNTGLKIRSESQFIPLLIAGELKIAMLWAETGLLPRCGLNLTSP